MAKARPKPRILFVCSQNSDGHVDPGAFDVLKQLVQLLNPLQEQGHLDIWVEEPDSRIYLEDVLSQRPSRQFLTILHVIGPLVDGQIKVRARNGSGLVSPHDEIWAREEWPFLRGVIFSGEENIEWQSMLMEGGIPMVLNTGANLESSIEIYLHLMAGNPILESAMSFVDTETGIFAYKGEGKQGRWTTQEPSLQSRTLAYLENKARALAWRLRNPLLIPSSEKQWLTQQIQQMHELLLAQQTGTSTEKGDEARVDKEKATHKETIAVAQVSEEKTEATGGEEQDLPEINSGEVEEVISSPDPALTETDIQTEEIVAPVIEERISEEVEIEAEKEPATKEVVDEAPAEKGEDQFPSEEKDDLVEPVSDPISEETSFEESSEVIPEVQNTTDDTLESVEENATIPVEEETKENTEDGTEEEIVHDNETVEELVEETREELSSESESLDETEEIEPELSSLHQLAPLFPVESNSTIAIQQSEEEKSKAEPTTSQHEVNGEPDNDISSVSENTSSTPKEEIAVKEKESELVTSEVAEPKSPAKNVKKPRPAKRPNRKKSRKTPQKVQEKEVEKIITAEKNGSPEKLPKPAQREKTIRKVQVSQEEKPIKPKEPLPKARKRSWAIWGGITLISGLIAISFMFPGILSGIGGIGQENPCPFPTEDENYHVLILSFIEEGECSPSDMIHEEVLLKQLKALRQEGIHVDVRVLDVEDCENRTGKAEGIAQTCGADLIIWGKYNGQAVPNSRGSLQYFVADQQYASILSSEQSYQEEVKFQSNLIVGDLPTLHATNLLYWYEALYQKEEGHSMEVVRYLEAMEPLEGEREPVRIQFLRNAYLTVGLFGKAKRLYDNLIAANPSVPSYYLDRAEILKRMGLYESAINDYNKALELEPGDLESMIGRGIIYIEKGDYNLAVKDFSQLIRENDKLALAYLHRGDAYAEEGITWRASQDYDKALDLNPEYAEAYLGRAKLKLTSGQREAALEDIEAALRIKPGMQEAILFEPEIQIASGEYDVALNKLNQLLESTPTAKTWFTKGQLLEKVKELGRAEAAFTEAISLSPAYHQAIMNRGKTRFNLMKMSLAKTDFLKVVSLRPTDTEAMAWLGRSLASLDDPDSAKVWFEKALETDPQLAEPLIYLAEMKYGEGKYEEALKDVNQLIISGTRRTDVFLLRGKVHAERGAVFPAVNDFDRVIQLDKTISQAYVERAKLRLRLKNTRGVIEDLDAAIRYKTNDATAYLMRAEQYILENEYEAVPSMFAEALKLDSTMTQVYEARGAYLQKLNRHDQAITDFNQAISLNPAVSPQVYLMRGKSLAAKKLNNEAMLDYNNVLRTWPDSASVYCARGMLYQSMGQLNQAQEDFEQALEIDPNNALTFYSQGVLYLEMKNFERALELFDEAIALDAKYAGAYNRRGEVFVEMESFDRALSDFSTALQLDPTLGRAYRNRGNLERKVSEYEAAIRDYSQAVTYDPSDAESYYNRGFLYAIQERYDMAVPDIRKSLELDPEDGLRYGFLAKIYARQGKEELFYQNIEIALSKNYPMIELDHDPAFKEYRKEDRFQNLLKRYQR